MGSKDKKRKHGKQQSQKARKPRPVGETRAEAPEPEAEAPKAAAPARMVPAKVEQKAKPPKPAKAAPVLSRKPSRFRFFANAFQELRKAHWPTRREALRLSLMVAIVCLVVGALLGALDFAFSGLMRLLLF